ncbi:8801_t:CDS:1, partial [Funneliformis geosporum]
DLIKRCWDNDPLKRPVATEIEGTLKGWYFDMSNSDAEFHKQLKEAEEFNRSLPKETQFPNYEKNPKTIYHSKFIDTNYITKLMQTQEVTSGIDCLSIDDQNVEEYQTQIPPK